MPLPKLPPFDYTILNKLLKEVKNSTLDEVTMLTTLHTLILENTDELADHIGRLEAIMMLLETAKGRAESGYSDREIVECSAQRSVAKNKASVIDKTYFLINQKAKILSKNT